MIKDSHKVKIQLQNPDYLLKEESETFFLLKKHLERGYCGCMLFSF